MSAELLEVAWRAGKHGRARTRLVLCALADLAQADTGKVDASVADIAEHAGLPLHSTVRAMYELETGGVLDVAFAQVIGYGHEPDRPQTFLLNAAWLRDRAGMRDRVDEVMEALGAIRVDTQDVA